MEKLEYYYFPNSHWSRVISLVVAEKGLEPERHFVDIRTGATFEPEYMRLNPRGVVPTLVHGGRALCNSPRIAAYLDEIAKPHVCHQDEGWAERLEDFPLMHLSYSVWVLGKKGENSAQILADKIERAGRLAEEHADLSAAYLRKQEFFREFDRDLHDKEYGVRTRRLCQATLDDLAKRVTQHEWASGDAWGLADAIATSVLYRLIDLELLDEWSKSDGPLLAYYERLRLRPSFAAVFANDPLSGLL